MAILCGIIILSWIPQSSQGTEEGLTPWNRVHEDMHSKSAIKYQVHVYEANPLS